MSGLSVMEIHRKKNGKLSTRSGAVSQLQKLLPSLTSTTPGTLTTDGYSGESFASDI